MTEREAPSRDFEYLPDDLDDEGGWFGHVPFVQEHRTEPIPLTPELLGSPIPPDNGQSEYYDEPEQISVHPASIEHSAPEFAPADEAYDAPAPDKSDVGGAATHLDYALAADYYESEPAPVEAHLNTEHELSTADVEHETDYDASNFAEPDLWSAEWHLSGAPAPFADEPFNEYYEAKPAPVPVAPLPVRPPSPRPDPAWTTNGQPRLTEIDPLQFKTARQPWYRSRKALIGVIGAAVLVLLVVIVSLAVGTEDTTEPAPTTTPAPATSSAPAAPSAVQPTLTSAPAPPPPPPPPPVPPPPPPVENNAPAYTPRYQPPRRADPSPQRKPQTGVTRAPISVAPKHTATPSGPEVGGHGANDGGWGWG